MKLTREQVRVAQAVVANNYPPWLVGDDEQRHDIAVSLGLLACPSERLFLLHCNNVVTAAIFGDDMPTIEDAVNRWQDIELFLSSWGQEQGLPVEDGW